MTTARIDIVALFVRAAGYGIVMGALVGGLVLGIVGIVDDDSAVSLVFSLGPLWGAGFGLVTGLILALMLVVTMPMNLNHVVRRIFLSLSTAFIVGGLGGLIGLSAPELATYFGAPAAVAVWIVYPRVLKGRDRGPMPALGPSHGDK